ncbi:MAG: glycine cleavage system protein GcvH [Gammaproteobacteria bacterium]|nr:glycine cleavage system protein GcvH [Gammaproteobacteria bacterium]MDD9800890.1 glycine cleavage system protein GcvH [Gammaproteobacteria bacterium]MDD9816009.1 glycine cleavage system protein GcvH [Gammaproteobacteria bacterium]MDD9850604.1 glycine cleavage system protein GcvH [Gammaproteobacteria bacterium]MDD9871157.1 glycine cleavage system protein GcvH [Gammaproteobacteria bacterium]
MSETRFTSDHEWARKENGTAVVGITDYAQEQLGELVFVELPAVGDAVTKGGEAAVVESVKAAGEVKSPLSGTVTEVNTALADDPGAVNSDAAGAGWIYKMQLSAPQEFDSLLDADAYNALVAAAG